MGLGAYGAYRPIQSPRLLYAPTSPSFLQRLPVWVRVTERKADDFWGILGLLSGAIGGAG
jgi:hypothetical protein